MNRFGGLCSLNQYQICSSETIFCLIIVISSSVCSLVNCIVFSSGAPMGIFVFGCIKIFLGNLSVSKVSLLVSVGTFCVSSCIPTLHSFLFPLHVSTVIFRKGKRFPIKHYVFVYHYATFRNSKTRFHPSMVLRITPACAIFSELVDL